MRVVGFTVVAAVAGCIALGGVAQAEERRVTNAEELTAALDAAGEGDEIVLEPGTYAGQLYRETLRQVTIRSAALDHRGIVAVGAADCHLA